MAFIERTDRGVLLHLHVVPGAARTEIAGLHGDRLEIRVKAAAAERAANRELLRFLADLFEVGPSYLEIVLRCRAAPAPTRLGSEDPANL